MITAYARAWMQNNAATFVYDGSNLHVDDVRELPCDNCWEVVTSFTSDNAGYGDRTGETTASVVTDHTTILTFKDNVVVAAVTDGAYDEFRQRIIPSEAPPEYTQGMAKNVAEAWIRDNAESYIFGGYDLEFRSVWLAPCPNCYNVVYKFKSISDRYGGSIQEGYYRDPDTGRLFDPDDIEDDIDDDPVDDELHAGFDNLDEHTILIEVREGIVTRAITDGIYDEIDQDFVNFYDDNDEDIRNRDLADAVDIAEEYMKLRAETFIYDGFNLRLADADKAACDDCYLIAFEFQSRYPGYGDRSGEYQRLRTTRHRTVVRLEDNELVYMITDNIYDELEREFI
jgi:hypothetical protein